MRAVAKADTLADGGYTFMLPYHAARQGWLAKMYVGTTHLSPGVHAIGADQMVHYDASDRVKLSHHNDGFVQFSSENSQKIRSGRDPLTGKPRGLGYMSVPILQGIPSGPAFGATLWGLHQYQEVTTSLRASDVVFRREDLYFNMSPPADCDGYQVEGWLLDYQMWQGVRGPANDLRINIGGMKFGHVVLATRELRVIPIPGTYSFLGFVVMQASLDVPSDSGFIFGGPREFEPTSGYQLIAQYPRDSEPDADSINLDYKTPPP